MSRTLHRGLRLLDELAAAGGQGLRLTDLAAKTSLDPATTQRLLGSLAEYGYCRQDPRTKLFHVTSRVLSLASSYRGDQNIRTVAAPHLSALRDDVGEVVHLGVLEGSEVVYIDKFQAENPITLRSGIGEANPLHTTSLGKALLSTMDDAAVLALLGDGDLERRTEKTITDRRAFLREIALTAQRGYSIDDRENEDLITCVGAPIVNRAGLAIAAISVSGPTYRMEHRVEEVGSKVAVVSQTIGMEV